MAKLKVKFENGQMEVEVDGKKIETIKVISLISHGFDLKCAFTHNSFAGSVTSEKGEIEFSIPDDLAKALGG